ncbi:hypothetical protein F2Q70_00004240 [Brassica cretica]|uniref:Uncharacterized protein n=1 Tax=Brassica cretica TaxID=69181 RepID=A0A8S9IN56_BRACR|nr:hypothetical protein F2Q70_00004240 [Brassica cretica]
MHSGCSGSGTAIKTVLRENHQIALFSASFVPPGPSHIQCNSKPVMTRKGLERLDKDWKDSIKTQKHFRKQCSNVRKTQHIKAVDFIFSDGSFGEIHNSFKTFLLGEDDACVNAHIKNVGDLMSISLYQYIYGETRFEDESFRRWRD